MKLAFGVKVTTPNGLTDQFPSGEVKVVCCPNVDGSKSTVDTSTVPSASVSFVVTFTVAGTPSSSIDAVSSFATGGVPTFTKTVKSA